METKNMIVLALLTLLYCLSTATPLNTDVSTTQPITEQYDPLIERSSHGHYHAIVKPNLKGIWKKNFVWRPRWVKTWQEKKVYVAVWKKMWGPVKINEWVPIPQPPPGWVKHLHKPVVVKKIHH